MQTKYGPQNHSCESFDRNKWAVNIKRIYLVLLCRIWKIPLCNELFYFFCVVGIMKKMNKKNHLWNMSIFSLFSSINRPFLTSSFQVFLFLLKKKLFERLFRGSFAKQLFIETEKVENCSFRLFWNVYVIQTLNFIQSVNSFRSLN